MSDELTAAGGLVVPIDVRFTLPNTWKRPLRDSFVEVWDRIAERNRLAPEDRIAFDIEWRGHAESGYPDVAARVAEWRPVDAMDNRLWDHEWDQPVRLAYAR